MAFTPTQFVNIWLRCIFSYRSTQSRLNKIFEKLSHPPNVNMQKTSKSADVLVFQQYGKLRDERICFRLSNRNQLL